MRKEFPEKVVAPFKRGSFDEVNISCLHVGICTYVTWSVINYHWNVSSKGNVFFEKGNAVPTSATTRPRVTSS